MKKEISAEMWLGYFYPELEEKWVVRKAGTFYRNYNADIMSLNADTGELTLSRDGFMRYLPDTLIADVDELKGNKSKENHKRVARRRRVLEDAFVPFDTIRFRSNLRIEREVKELLESKQRYVLREFFDIDLDAVTNPYVREVALLLPFVSRKRGDLQFVATLLRTLYDCEVEMDMSHRYSETDSTRNWLPMVRYDIMRQDMTAEQYRMETELLAPLADFLREWFLPFDVVARISFRQHGIKPYTDSMLVLDYNSMLM